MYLRQNALFGVFYQKIAYVHKFFESAACRYEETNHVLDTPQRGNASGKIQKATSRRIFFQKDMNFWLGGRLPSFREDKKGAICSCVF